MLEFTYLTNLPRPRRRGIGHLFSHVRSHNFLHALCLIVLLPTWSGCLMFAGRHWDEARANDIEPLNTSLHRHLPRDIKAKDLDAILAAYATDSGTGLIWGGTVTVPGDANERRLRWTTPGSEPIRERYEHLFAIFDTVERAELRIHRVYWNERDRGYPADVRLIVRGVADGEHRMLDQRSHVVIDRVDAQWVIVSEEVTTRELVGSTQPRFELITEQAIGMMFTTPPVRRPSG